MFKVLIAEDNAILRGTLREVLEARFAGVEISEAANAWAALRRIELAPPDLAIMDFSLRGKNGLELARAIRTAHSSIPIIILTSYDLPEYREAATSIEDERLVSNCATSTDQMVKLVESLPEGYGIGTTGRDLA